jgi:hypothetical protein
MLIVIGIAIFIAGFALGGWAEAKLRDQREELSIKYGPRSPDGPPQR